MKNLLIKEMRLSAHPLSFIFLAFTLMAFIPGYPILVSAFFVCFGIFQTFQNGRETNDVLYTVLLPIEKKDAVNARFVFVCFIQLISAVLSVIFTAVRMTFLAEAVPYATNPMMNSTPVYIAWTFIVFALFNAAFVGPFFRTAYKFGKPFVTFIVLSVLAVGTAEILHHVPGLGFFNTPDRLGTQILIAVGAFLIYAAVTALSLVRARKRFEKLDL